MNGQSYLVVVLALGCIAAVGMSATTLDSSLSTDPDDVIDIDYKYLPFGKDTGETLKQAGQPDSGDQPNARTSDQSDLSEQAHQQQNQQRNQRQQEEGSGGGGGTAGSSGSGDGQGTGPGPSRSLFDLLGPLLALLLALLVLALAYRYRDRLLALLHAVTARVGGRYDRYLGSGVARWPESQPANEVQRAWLAVVERANPDRPWTRTPEECAQGAVDAGLDSETVRTITTLFEEVRYGGKPVTEERRERAREGLRRLETARGSASTRVESTDVGPGSVDGSQDVPDSGRESVADGGETTDSGGGPRGGSGGHPDTRRGS